jgi:hypothetical protein
LAAKKTTAPIPRQTRVSATVNRTITMVFFILFLLVCEVPQNAGDVPKIAVLFFSLRLTGILQKSFTENCLKLFPISPV